MNILVANDDGINARGIHELVRALSEVADIYVAAPNVQKSAAGHGITAHEKIYIEETEFPYAKKAVSLTGTPADCVKIGQAFYRTNGIEMDMVFAGINHGANVGTDTLYSGTVSAAIEGNICGLPAVAVSVGSHFPKYFDYACELAARTAQKVFGKLGKHSTLSINVPNLPYEKIKGIVYAPLGRRKYDNWFGHDGEEDGKQIYVYKGEPSSLDKIDDDDVTDVAYISRGYATITALKHDFTDWNLTEEIRNWRI